GPGSARPVLADNERTWKVVAGDWSYIFSGRESREELYHLQRDPGELVELLEQEKAAARELRGMVTAAIRAGREHPYLLDAAAIRTVPMSKQVEETLRALGYLD
ncbi:MAG TPA: hypothetical protein VNB06_14145, partial [Thermoanaerobaculia bacterium]|nr:hypothetical protein [Thermoanaerobaculia bacterium]